MKSIWLGLTIGFLGIGCQQLKAQDFQFSQYYAAPLYLNPAFTGTGKMHRFTANGRMQWPHLPKAYRTIAVSYDYNLEKLSSGFGLLLTKDAAGSGDLGNTNVGFLYSYKTSINDQLVISAGTHFAYNFAGLNRNGLTLGDQLASDRDVSFDTELTNVQNIQYFDFSTGVLVYSKMFWGGVAFHHITEPNMSLVGDSNPLDMKISVHAGIRIPLYRGPKEFDNISSIAPSFIYKQQGEFNQLDIGINWHYDPISAGIWYRGVPFGKSEQSDLYDRDALVFMFGFKFPEFEAGYSYDFTISELGGSSGGAHEISIVYDFVAKIKQKRKERFLPCPTF
ncbi:type IX secretion system membrane protein PorP/SprF [Marivirga sp. S37H4]|uniref:Type IX secretion system membrane protein PorP/SprF n=1 Tax=Marivirga aurantiaca TaxID=2802615 RepID=A0A934WW97_9BACT|nr:type IX secretion system membrane protein PorP/SprF [Marivirga aurantiaca]